VNSTTDTTIFDAAILLAFIVLGATCWYRRISYRIRVVGGLLFLIVAAASVAVGQHDAGNFVAVLAYYALVVGVSLAVVEWRKEERVAGAAVDSPETTRAEEAAPPPSSAISFRRLRALWKRLHP
jgi:disulfide bond formation protein DsbB